nr:caspase-7 isoform X4 [Kogia breviceps]
MGRPRAAGLRSALSGSVGARFQSSENFAQHGLRGPRPALPRAPSGDGACDMAGWAGRALPEGARGGLVVLRAADFAERGVQSRRRRPQPRLPGPFRAPGDSSPSRVGAFTFAFVRAAAHPLGGRTETGASSGLPVAGETMADSQGHIAEQGAGDSAGNDTVDAKPDRSSFVPSLFRHDSEKWEGLGILDPNSTGTGCHCGSKIPDEMTRKYSSNY